MPVVGVSASGGKLIWQFLRDFDFSWCRWWESNPHGLAPTGFWVQRVCQFHHTGFLYPLSLPHSYKITYGAVICALLLCIKETCRKFIVSPVIMEAITAFIFSVARLIRTVTKNLILFHFTFHNNNLPSLSKTLRNYSPRSTGRARRIRSWAQPLNFFFYVFYFVCFVLFVVFLFSVV